MVKIVQLVAVDLRMVLLVDQEPKAMIIFARHNLLPIQWQNPKQFVIMSFSNSVLLKIIQLALKTMDIFATILTILDSAILL
jgi:hypothetical protein